MIDYLKIFFRYNRFIIKRVLLIIIIASLLSFILPVTYRASTVLMPPLSDDSTDIFTNLSDFPLGGLFPESSDPTMNIIAILKSRTVMVSIINKFYLIQFYNVNNIEEAIETLTKNISFVVEDEGTIRVAAFVSTGWLHPEKEEIAAKQLSADIANYFIIELDIVNKKLATEEATYQRKFIEKRYERNLIDLKLAENNLKEFMLLNKMVSLDEQTKAAIQTAASIKGQIMSNEAKLDVINKSLNSGHPEINLLVEKIIALKSKLKEMDNTESNNLIRNDGLFPSFSSIPTLSEKLSQLEREVEIQNTLFMFLTQQYEEAKIQEAKDTPTIQILDIAVPPEEKYSPFRTIIVLFSGFGGTILLTLYVFYKPVIKDLISKRNVS